MSRDDEIKSLHYPEGDVVCWSPAYAKRDLAPDDPDAAAIVLGLLQCQLTPPDTEYDAVGNMTGRYESKGSMCCVNQAGYHIEIWYSSKSSGRKLFRFGADYNPSAGGAWPTFELREPDDITPFLDPTVSETVRSEPLGLFKVTGSSTFEVSWNDGTSAISTFRRFSRRATLSDRLVAQLEAGRFGRGHPIIEGWLENEHRPASDRRMRELVDFLVHDHADDKGFSFKEHLQALFSIEVDDSILHRAEVQSAIGNLVEPIRKLTEKAFVVEDSRRVASLVLPAILDSRLNLFSPSGIPEIRSRYAWLQRVIAYNENHTFNTPASVGVIKTWLGVTPAKPVLYELDGVFTIASAEVALPLASKLRAAGKYGRVAAKKGVAKFLDWVQKHRWDWGATLKKHRAKIEKKIVDKVGMMLGDLIETHAGGKVLFGVLRVRAPDGSWEAEYDVQASVFIVGMGGASVGLESEPMTAKGWAESPVDWKPSSFPGTFTVLPGLMATDAYGNRAEKQMIWVLDGRGTTSTIQLVFDQVKSKTSDMDLGVGGGYIGELDEDDVEYTTFGTLPMFEYTTEYKQQDAIQFQLGSATLRWSGRQMLRVFAANELALLRDPTSRVDVEGFADRIGQRWYNKQLSEARAANIRQALADCLGGDLNATVETQGHGEDVLAAIGEAFFPDEKGSEQWRRGFVVMNAQVAAKLGTNDPTVRRKKK